MKINGPDQTVIHFFLFVCFFSMNTSEMNVPNDVNGILSGIVDIMGSP